MGFALFDGALALWGDNAEFIILGRSLAAGEGLSYINQPAPTPATKYPFGFPLMLAAVEFLLPGSIHALKALVVILYALSIPLTFRLLTRHASTRTAAAVCAFCLASPLLLDFSHQVMSEVPYLAVSTLGLILVQRAVRSGSHRDLLWSLLAVMAAYHIRTAGVTLIAATVVYLTLTGRRRQSALFAAGAVLLALPWAVRNHLYGAGAGYLNQLISVDPYRPQDGTLTLASLLERVTENLKIYGLRDLPGLFLPTAFGEGTPPLHLLAWAIGIALGGLLLGGLAVCLHRKQLPAVYLVFYLAMCLLWPHIFSSNRFLLPVVPLLYYCVISGVGLAARAVRSRVPPRLLSVAGYALAALVLLSNAQATVKLAGEKSTYPRHWARYYQAGLWIRDHAPLASVVACRKPFLMCAFSSRRTVGYPFTDDHEELIAGLEASGADIVVVDSFSNTSVDYLAPAVLRHHHKFRKLHFIKDPDIFIVSLVGNAPAQE